MRRALLLVLCIVLAILSFGPLSPPVAAQQQLPAAFVGQWEGTLVQTNPSSSYPVTIDLTGGTVGSNGGAIAYPTLGCSGNLVLQGASASQVTLTERLTVGQSLCPYVDATITLTLSDGSLTFGWSHPNWAGTLTGTLERVGGAALPDPSPAAVAAQPDAAELVEALAARDAAPSLTGPLSGSLIRSASAFPAASGAGVSVEDFTATVTIVAPSDSTTLPWDFGLAFGSTPDTTQQLVIASTGGWSYWTAPEGNMRSGWVTLNLAPGATNTLDVVVQGATALFGINGQFVARIELLRTVAADVEVITGFLVPPSLEEEGRVLTYTNFQVWAATPLSGQTDVADAPGGDQPPGKPETTQPLSGAFFVTPNSTECVVTPRTATSYPALATELDASMLDLVEAIQTPGLDVPEGVPADPMTTWAVVDTYRQMTACARASGDLGRFALWTDDALRQYLAEPPTDASGTEDWPESFRVSDVRVLPDGRVVAVFEGRDPGTELTFVQVLVWQGIRFLVDETLDSAYLKDGVDMLAPQPEALASLSADFIGRWEGTVMWDDSTMPVTLDLIGGSVGEIVGTVEYSLYGSAGPTCGGDVFLENIAADGDEVVLAGTITHDASVCLVDATVQISFQDTGAVGYLWNHPALTVSGTGVLVRTTPTN